VGFLVTFFVVCQRVKILIQRIEYENKLIYSIVVLQDAVPGSKRYVVYNLFKHFITMQNRCVYFTWKYS